MISYEIQDEVSMETFFPLIAFPVSLFTVTKLITGTCLSFVVSFPILTPRFASFFKVKSFSNVSTSIAGKVAFGLAFVSGSE